MSRNYFQLSQSDLDQTSGGFGEDYNGDAEYSKNYGYALDPKDYALYSDSRNMVSNNNPMDYADNSFLSDLPAKSMWEEAALKNNDYPVSDYNRLEPFLSNRRENFGEELEIKEDCDDQIQTYDGSYWQFAYKDLNATTNDCMCHYTNKRYPDYLPGWRCYIVEKNRPSKGLLAVPEFYYPHIYSCLVDLEIKAGSSTQVNIPQEERLAPTFIQSHIMKCMKMSYLIFFLCAHII